MNKYNETLYDMIGGEQTVRRMVEAFYPRVQQEPLLAPLFPEDITPVLEKQFLFLTQFFGGPMLYTEQNGHPMMRARHLPFPITIERARAWLSCMDAALVDIGMPPELREMVMNRLSGPAHHFVNQS